MGDAGQFQRAILLGAEALPLVFKNIVACPLFLPFRRVWVLHTDNFVLTLKVKVNRPVVDPICPVFR